MSALRVAADKLKALYGIPNTAYGSPAEVDRVWRAALGRFDLALAVETDKDVLETCLTDDPNWLLPVDARLRLLRKAKRLGASSSAFLLDYHGYLAAHLDPGPDKTMAAATLDALISATGGTVIGDVKRRGGDA